jgi:hypothetical protein
MPPWATADERRRAAASSSVRSSRDGVPSDPYALKTELERARLSHEEVARERDLLKRQVASMEKLVQQRLAAPGRAPAPRPASAPPSARSANAPRDGGQTAREKRLNKDAEKELLNRLNGRTWRPKRDARGSGVEQLKRRLEEQEMKRYAEARQLAETRGGKKEVEKKSRAEVRGARARADVACAQAVRLLGCGC